MLIQINAGDIQSSEAIESHVRQEVEKELGVWKDRITRVEVHLRDDNGPKAGRDKRCLMEARLAGQKPLAVEHSTDDLYTSITETAGKLGRAVRHKVERRDEY